ncbi:minor tail protein [Mycobacterium phage Miramae]|uniref:Minor tail protein n=1 Tax=Mycobacterium phage Miramae TaxID=2517961 RepID=A0A482JFN2_9CAUD|nr:minor tail protein [Mycobacterium phage Miramae]QBP31418.1 minor tail protein [Mycobacterium phage Miramae]QBP32415.1 minor tail protein [Mycobacterium phage AvatarAhPeg]
MPADFIQHLPEQWVGLFAVLAFITYLMAQLAEKFPTVAKMVPLGRWWHKRQQRKPGRKAWVAEDNAVITAMQEQISTVVADLADVNDKLRVFTAFSVYDARYHHRIEVEHAAMDSCVLPKHYNIFEFEQLWRADPVAAATL